jgi:uncharacterized protein DUF29
LKNRAKSGIYQIDKIRVSAEEIESLGKSDRRGLRSQIRRILRHLFKLDATPAADPRAGWRTTIRDARVEIEAVQRDSPSLRREVEDFVSEEAGLAAKSAAAAFEQHGDAVRGRLDKGGFTAEQVLGGWFPEAADGAAHPAHR